MRKNRRVKTIIISPTFIFSVPMKRSYSIGLLRFENGKLVGSSYFVVRNGIAGTTQVHRYND